jgi:hypothetical protein
MISYSGARQTNILCILIGSWDIHIVGSEETVKTRRMFNTMRDNLSDDKIFTRITSGISEEGLEMKGSDIDIFV